MAKIFDPLIFDSEIFDSVSPKMFDGQIFDPNIFDTGELIIVTMSAQSVGIGSAILRGRVTLPHVARGFEWGKISESYTHSWTESGPFAAGIFTHPITDLDPNSMYYFKAKARLV